MFFDDLSAIKKIATRSSCSILVTSDSTKLKLRNSITLSPSENTKSSVITIDQIRDFINWSNNKESIDRYYIIQPADSMNESAQNAFLKTLEEPKPYAHFILVTEHPNLLLPTILSRTPIFYQRQTNQLDLPPKAKDQIMSSAKELIAADTKKLIAIANEISKHKINTREYAMDIVSTAIEILYKSYFKTGNTKFLSKLPAFIALHEHLSQNGHIKLHLVSDLC